MDRKTFRGFTQFVCCMDYRFSEAKGYFWNCRFDKFLGDGLVGIDVKDIGDTLYISGPVGVTKLSWKNFGVVRKENGLIIFNDRKKFGTFIGLLRRMIFGVLYGFREELELRGLGYRGFVGTDGLYLDLGDCHWIVCSIPHELDIRFQSRYHLLIKSCNYQVLRDFLEKVQKLRSVNVYTGMGLRIGDAGYRIKVGKVKDK